MPTSRSQLGTWGEELASRYLVDQGYQVLAANYRCAYGEVDIVTQDGEELVFVEVRTRHPGGFGTPEESLSKHKLRRLLATCQHYIQQRAQENAQWRIDLISVYLERYKGESRQLRQVSHLRNVLEQ